MAAQIPQSKAAFSEMNADQIQEMKRLALQQAIDQYNAQQEERQRTAQVPAPAPLPQTPNVVYVKRNLTIAEIGLVLLLATGILGALQFAGNFVIQNLPTIEIKTKK
jgi:hypothetical protein